MITRTIKQILDTRQVVEHYGYKVNRQGFTPCPFHQDKTASMKVYSGNRGWNCFGCGQNGSVIDFVMKVFGLNLSQAITRLNYDFGLNLTNERPDPKKIKEENRKKREKERFERVKALIEEYWLLEFKKYYRQFHDNKPKNTQEEPSELYIQAMLKLPQLEERVTGGESNYN